MDKEFWKDKDVLVTGGNGFLGKEVCRLLYEASPRRVYAPSHKEYDLKHRDQIKDLLDITLPHIVIHLAADVGGIGYNREHPADLITNNIRMSQILELSYKWGVDKFVAIGTVCAYPKFTPVPFKEESLWDGYPEETNAPYGIAKKVLLVQSQAYREQFGFNSIYLLPVNLYGVGDNFNDESSHVIPALIKKIVNAKEDNLPEVEIWGDGTPTREFLYVTDCAKGILEATEKYNEAEPINLGTGREYSIAYIANLIGNIVGYNGIFRYNLDKPNGQPRRMLDVSKAREKFGWEAEVELKEGLRKTINWYISNNIR